MVPAPEHLSHLVPDSAAALPCLALALAFLRDYARVPRLYALAAANGVLGYLAVLAFDRSFYGIFAASLVPLAWVLFRERDDELADRYAAFWALNSLLTLALLKLRCLAEGCCWGRFSRLPWAIYYKESRAMPYLLVPVHPVQLYEALGALLAAAGFALAWRTGRLRDPRATAGALLVTMALLRAGTGLFRGDGSAGVNAAVSCALLVVGLALLSFQSNRPTRSWSSRATGRWSSQATTSTYSANRARFGENDTAGTGGIWDPVCGNTSRSGPMRSRYGLAPELLPRRELPFASVKTKRGESFVPNT